MYKLYNIITTSGDVYYIGMTKTSLESRLISHIYSCNKGVKTKLYDYMRKYGTDKFLIHIVDAFDTKVECCQAEVDAIALARERGEDLLNLANGGEGGFVVQDIPLWKFRLSEARKGGQPALGLRHTDETKDLCSAAALEYWMTQDTYNPEVILKKNFKEANEIWGISKTHYYRLKKACEIL